MALLDNIALFYNGGEASGNLVDSVGSNTLTDNNTVGSASATPHSGTARDFETANSEYFSIADNATVRGGDVDWSWQAWVKPETDINHIILGKDIDTPSNARDYTFDVTATTPRLYINGGAGGLLVNGNVAVSAGNWYHICCGHSASANELWMIVNNNSAATVGTSGAVPETSVAPLYVGARAYSGAEAYFDGLIYRVGFWKRDIRSDVATLYNSGTPLDYAGMGGGGGGNRRRRILICG
jgi:hypothetical protein